MLYVLALDRRFSLVCSRLVKKDLPIKASAGLPSADHYVDIVSKLLS